MIEAKLVFKDTTLWLSQNDIVIEDWEFGEPNVSKSAVQNSLKDGSPISSRRFSSVVEKIYLQISGSNTQGVIDKIDDLSQMLAYGREGAINRGTLYSLWLYVRIDETEWFRTRVWGGNLVTDINAIRDLNLRTARAMLTLDREFFLEGEEVSLDMTNPNYASGASTIKLQTDCYPTDDLYNWFDVDIDSGEIPAPIKIRIQLYNEVEGTEWNPQEIHLFASWFAQVDDIFMQGEDGEGTTGTNSSASGGAYGESTVRAEISRSLLSWIYFMSNETVEEYCGQRARIFCRMLDSDVSKSFCSIGFSSFDYTYGETDIFEEALSRVTDFGSLRIPPGVFDESLDDVSGANYLRIHQATNTGSTATGMLDFVAMVPWNSQINLDYQGLILSWSDTSDVSIGDDEGYFLFGYRQSGLNAILADSTELGFQRLHPTWGDDALYVAPGRTNRIYILVDYGKEIEEEIIIDAHYRPRRLRIL